jgi:hypothetical protein
VVRFSKEEIGTEASIGRSVLVLSGSGSDASEADDVNDSPVTRLIPTVPSSASETLKEGMFR